MLARHRARKIHLVQNSKHTRRINLEISRPLPNRVRRINQPKHQVGVLNPSQGPPDTLAFDRSVRIAQARRIRQHDGISTKIEPHFEHITRGPGIR